MTEETKSIIKALIRGFEFTVSLLRKIIKGEPI